MTKNIVIKIEPFRINITPLGFHKYAHDYYTAAEQWTNKIKDTSYSPVPYFLYCRAIELGLKAYLLGKRKKIKYVHDLTTILRDARLNSLDHLFKTTEQEENEILIANNIYNKKGFEYFFVLNHVTKLKDLPKLNVLRKYSEKLLREIEELVKNTDVD